MLCYWVEDGLMRMHPFLVSSLACLGIAVQACGNVAPYQRGKLAHPSMQPESGQSPGREHMQAVQEGASGGTESHASGCGCN
jgi:hypothetical protein